MTSVKGCHSGHGTLEEGKKGSRYKWDSGMPTAEPGAIGALKFIMNGNMVSRWNTMTALYRPM